MPNTPQIAADDYAVQSTGDGPSAPPKPGAAEKGPPTVQKILGKVESTEHRKFVSDVIVQWEYYLGMLETPWANTVRAMRLYLTKRTSRRKNVQDEWMADVFVPKPHSTVEGKTAQQMEILNSADPIIQPDPQLDTNFINSKGMSRLLDYMLRANKWRKVGYGLVKMANIQGVEFYQTAWKRKAYKLATYHPQESKDYDNRLADSLAGLNYTNEIPDYKDQPAEFNDFREQINKTGKVNLPEPPNPYGRELVSYEGPWLERIPLYDLAYDPTIDEIQEQTCVIRRVVRTKAWLKQGVKEGRFDSAAVDSCMKAGGDINESTHDRTINQLLGITGTKVEDPYYENGQEVLEIHWPDKEVPYSVILNRKGVINVNPDYPFGHGEIEYGMIRPNWVPGRMIGLSDLLLSESLYQEYNSLRNLRLDRTTLETFPVFTEPYDMALTEMARRLVPGAVLRTVPGRQLSQLIQYANTNAFQDLHLIGAEIDDQSGVYDSVKGAPATVNRVSATDSVNRLSNAEGRIKIGATLIEEDFRYFPQQGLFLFFEKGTPQMRVRVAGQEITVTRQDLYQGLGMDYNFRGATMQAQADADIQRLLTILKEAAATLLPPEQRELARRVAESSKVRGLDLIFTSTGTQIIQLQTDAQLKTLQIQAKQAELAALAGQVTPPTEIPADQAQQLAGGPQGGAAGVGGANAGQGQQQPGAAGAGNGQPAAAAGPPAGIGG